ncbi:MAG: sodium/hydrogen exchanger [Chthoniobacteraceae bacterium]|nr:sodium/hydrogen exchanger [Chthoniobacteraceae bacterium]
MHDLIRDITYSIAAAWILGLAAQFFRQPLLLAYLIGGFALGPSGFKLIESAESISAISELGLIFLLFMIGLEIDLKKIISAGRSITLTALSQIVGGALLGVTFFRLCGFGLGLGGWDALYLGIAGALSSTVIIVKLLYEKQELDTLTGRITLGVLVLQDLAAILFLAVQPNLEHLAPSVILMSIARVVLMVAVTLAVSRYVLPAVFRHIARLPELVQVGALAWCFLIGELGERLHLSREMGALIAGVALSTFPYALDVTAKVTSLRDFFVTLFFVGLGMQIPMPTGQLVGWAVVFAGFVMISRFLSTFIPLYLMKQGLRTSLIPAINLSQVSEFSLVVLALGAQAGHLRHPATSGMVALAFTLLAAVSTFGMTRSAGVTLAVIPWLKKAGLRDLDHTPDDVHTDGAHGHGAARIIFLGFFRTASSLLEEMQRHAPDLIGDTAVIDFSPVARAGLVERKVRVIYGDISQRDTLLHAGVERAEVLISTVPDSMLKGTSNERLVRLLRGLNPHAKIIATAEMLVQAEVLLEAGADYVSIARLREADDLLEAVRAATEGLLEEKRTVLQGLLKDRREVLT